MSSGVGAAARIPGPRKWIAVVFFLSGFAALIYQVVWQRSLYALFGINVESVTLVVTAFLLGIGIGSLLGGIVSRSARPIVWFAVAEGAVGIYGLFSLELFQAVSARIITAPEYVIGTVIVALLIVPTVLMGMTLPLLVSSEVRRIPETARAVGLLYFVNTAGSACAAAATVILLLPLLGEQRSVYCAAALNLAAASFVMMQVVRRNAA